LGKDLLFSLLRFFFSALLFGAPKRQALKVLLRLEFFVHSLEVSLKALLLQSVPIFSFSMNGVGGWVFMSSVSMADLRSAV
jgi:hypothetical protein